LGSVLLVIGGAALVVLSLSWLARCCRLILGSDPAALARRSFFGRSIDVSVEIYVEISIGVGD